MCDRVQFQIFKGYEFDVGIHYIGDLGHLSMSKVLLDNISAGEEDSFSLRPYFRKKEGLSL